MKVSEILRDSSLWYPSEDYDTAIPDVTVILPTYKRAKSGLFEKAVLSVINQKMTNIELIIVDDCSYDGTFDLIKYFMKQDKRISCIRHSKNIGLPAISTFEAYQKSRGKYLAFIFDDNEWDSEFLQKTIVFMERKKVKASYGIIRGYGKDGSYVDFGSKDYIGNLSLLDLRWTNFIGNGGVVLHKDVIDKVGWYDPHITLTRLCDWDLWLRVSNSFIFERTDIFAGYEWGATLDDSLGNSVMLSHWTSWEQATFSRNEALKLNSFMDYDVSSLPNNATDLYYETLKDLTEQYVGKYWYDEKMILSPIEKVNATRKPRKRILVITWMLDATLTLSFERLIENNKDVFFKIVHANSITMSELTFADGVIFVRNLLNLDKVINACRYFNIPMWYYLDDNFIEIYKEKKKDLLLKQLADSITFKNLKVFNGVILSSQALIDYFKDNSIHSNFIKMEPIIDIDNTIGAFNEIKENLTVAFMGGSFRVNILLKSVIPALEKIGENIKVRLIYPEERIDKRFIEMCKNIEFIPVKVDYYLKTLLFRYMEYKPNLLVHCGEDNKNNKYKTENALINAVQIGSILITSDIEPYNSKNTSSVSFETCKNTIDDWYDKFRYILDNPKTANDIYQTAYDYCLEKYNIEICKDKINSIFDNIKTTGLGKSIIRFFDIYNDRFYMTNKFNTAAGYSKPVRSSIGIPLMLDIIKEKVSFNITCTVENFSELGLCFSSYGICDGRLIISIYKNKNKLREINMDMDDYVRDFWTYFEFETISNSLNETYTIVLEPEYSVGSSQIGVYEDMSKRTFLYKVFYKLGKRLNSKDVLFVDCRS